MDILKRFLNYVSYDTVAIEESETQPSNSDEIILLEKLVQELKDIGIKDAFYKNGFTYGKLKSDCNKKDSIFLMAHVDTSPDASGKNIKPRIVHYTGEPIKLNETRILDEKVFESMKYHKDHDLVVTDGTTLLGADDKAGIAIIMDVLERAIKNKNYPNIIVCFSSDEEIGRGTLNIDLDYIKNDENTIYAYTVDGGEITLFESENFNARHAKVIVTGTSIHPSIGKNKLINAQEVMMKFHSLLPLCKPENTEKREGFIHLCNSVGSVEKCEYDYILRSFEMNELDSYSEAFNKAKDEINKLYKKDIVEVKINDQYRNMRDIIDKNPYCRDIVFECSKEMGINMVVDPIRGGTDGATLSHMGLPCPNLGTGGDNFHGVYEYLDIDEMRTMTELILKIMGKIN